MKHLRKVLCLTYDSHSRREGILRLASARNWLIDFKRAYELPEDWNCDGALFAADIYASEEGQRLLASLQRRHTPIVVLEGVDSQILKHPGVTGDDRAIGALAARFFNERHFHHAAFFSSHEATQLPCQTARLTGFREAWNGSTLDVWLWSMHASGKDFTDRDKLQAWLTDRLRQAKKPLAVFAWNDVDASQILSVCLQIGLSVPDDVAILGVDNLTDICDHTPVKLSAIKHDLARVGHVGAAMLERLMSGGTLKRRFVRIKPQGVVERESTPPLVVYSAAIKPIIDYIDRNLSHTFGAAEISHTFGAAEISQALNVPRGRLDYLFSRETGHSIGTEIATRRINKAKELMRQTDLSIDSIAQQCGYCTRSFFAKRFRHATGMAPSPGGRPPCPNPKVN